ncbi:putative zinc-binding metallopeptidase [Aldersonia sp. NBC_00410]|uniref:zinc-binding metallopeptidase family protein n=1 Tax=Aldersonia sp. NBC_00410 TaxID=2975954 RepID=UPI00224D773D|nr:putative zinc-binding metallopeptidase [Aldersonia sp. NBC_00410]MCX5043087.1 putative zinc-binding metallopeptidase [Aldersonia sp. NBC_00410]
MRDFTCSNCGQELSFENSVCLKCGSQLGFSLAEKTLVVIGKPADPNAPAGITGEVDAEKFRLCDNLHVARCNWLIAADDEEGLCASCRLTTTRPSDDDAKALPAFADAEAAKRRLVLELVELGLPIVDREQDPETGLAFDLLSSRDENVITGHADGVITLDLAEGDDVHREQLRVSMAEPYRTLLGHFRHEVGHYYFTVLIDSDGNRARFEQLFGDPDASYQDALDRHYSEGAPEGWEEKYVSSYATMHAAEDWAETFAHYLHIRDTLDTAAAFGLAPAGATFDRPAPGPAGFDKIIELWLPLSWSLNMVNRSMGHHDLYPFVLPEPVLEKMRFVHEVITATQAAGIAEEFTV